MRTLEYYFSALLSNLEIPRLNSDLIILDSIDVEETFYNILHILGTFHGTPHCEERCRRYP